MVSREAGAERGAEPVGAALVPGEVEGVLPVEHRDLLGRAARLLRVLVVAAGGEDDHDDDRRDDGEDADAAFDAEDLRILHALVRAQ